MKGYEFLEHRHELHRGKYYQNIRNTPWYGDAEYHRFSSAEFARRMELVRGKMTTEGYDCLVIPGGQAKWSQGGAYTWLTGIIDRRSMAQYLVMPREDDPVVAYPMGGAHSELARIWSQLPVQTIDRGDYAATIADQILELGLAEGRVGVLEVTANPGVEWPPETHILNLKAALPGADIQLISGWFHELAFRKSDEEIEAISRAGKLAVAALDAMVASAKPGLTEHQLTAAATRMILSAEGRTDFVRVGSTRGKTPAITTANPLPSNRRLLDRDLLLLEVSVMLQGVTAHAGTILTLGEPTSEVQQFFDEVLVPGYLQLEAILQPGTPLTDIQQAGQFFREQGHQSAPLLLHGLDIEDSTPRVFVHEIQAEPYEQSLQPNMVVVLCSNPITADGKWGLCLSRTYLITETGHQMLTNVPLEIKRASSNIG